MLSHFKELYNKYVSGRIDPEEFQTLRGSIDVVSDDFLWSVMLEDSNENSQALSIMPKEMKAAVKRNLFRSIMRRRFMSFSRYAAVLLVAVAVALVTRVVPNQEFSASIPSGSRTSLVLPDMSKVQLNSASEITFDWDTEGERTVRLYGEAFFDVAKDAEHTFRVFISDIEVEVHGTSFNVNAYGDENITISLVSGQVSIVGSGLKGKSYVMRAGEKAVYNCADGTVSIGKADMNVETGWTRGDLVFAHKKFSDVIAMIERHYGVEIDVRSDTLANDQLTGTFRNEDISDVIANLSNMYRFKYKIEKNHITIY